MSNTTQHLLSDREDTFTEHDRSPITDAIECFLEVAEGFERGGEKQSLAYNIEDGPMQGRVEVVFSPNAYPFFY